MKNLLLCLLLIPVFVLADVPPPPAVIGQYPTLDAHHPNKISGGGNYTMTNGRVTITIPPSSPKPISGVSSSGSSISAGHPVNATVNNGYGNAGKISSQAASNYGKLGAIRAAANKSVGPISNAIIVYQLSHWTGTQLKNLYDCVSYQECHPDGQPLPVPPSAPAPPSVPFTPPTGGEYDPTKKNLIVIEKDGAPVMVFSSNGGISMSTPGQTGEPLKEDRVYKLLEPPISFTMTKGSSWGGYTIRDVTPEIVSKYKGLFYKDVHPEAYVPPVTAEDLYNALIWNMEHMPQEVATAIMNALHDGGYLGAPDGTVFDPASYTSPPYTAADTGTAQQDKFTLNQDGSMTHQVIARPDLQGNNQLAPEKQPSTNPTNPTDPTNPTNPTDPKPETPEIDWDMPIVPDTVIPTQEIPIFFSPDNTFNNNGVCPQPKTFAVFDHTFEISYEPMCDLAGKIRPVVELCGAFLAGLMVFFAMKGG